MLKTPPISLYFVILPNTLVLDWAGPAEAFRVANQRLAQLGQAARFEMHFVGPQSAPNSSVGLQLQGLLPLPLVFPTNSWVFLLGLPGDQLDINASGVPQTLQWLRRLALASAQPRFISVCAGALLLAHAGLLRGKRVTTHHAHLSELRQIEPQCEVVANQLFVQDNQLATSAGVTTGIDLCIELIAQACSTSIAAHVAHTLVMTQRRYGSDTQTSAFFSHRQHLHPAVHRVQDAVSESPQQPWDLAAMARIACVTARHLTRLFLEHTETTPMHYLRDLRLELAKKALQTGATVGQAAQRAGFQSDLQLRRAWTAAKCAGTPSAHRETL